MNYINEQLCFLRYLRNHRLSSGEVALWYAFFAASNNRGLGKEFSVSDHLLTIYSGLGQTRLAEARKLLIKRGLLACSPYRKREIRRYQLTSMEQLMEQSEESDIFLCEEEGVSNSETNSVSNCESNSETNSVTKSVSNSVTCIKEKEEQEQTQEQEKDEKKAYGTFENVLLSPSEYKTLFSLSSNMPEYINGLSLSLHTQGISSYDSYKSLLKKAKEEEKFRPTG